MATTFRLYGPEVGIEQYIVDADVTGATAGGGIELTPTDGGLDTFVIKQDRLRELSDEQLVHDKDTIDTSSARWKALEDVSTHADQSTDDSAPFERAARALFAGA